MTEAADRVEPNAPLAGGAPARVANSPVPNRLLDPDWIDWCDADR